MSKIGRRKIILTKKSRINIYKQELQIHGPIGCMSLKLLKSIKITIAENYMSLSNQCCTKNNSVLGLFRTLINNMIQGVNYGYIKKVEVTGIGYKVYYNEKFLVFAIGYSHDVVYHFPKNIIVRCVINQIEVFSCDKILLSNVCTDITRLKKLDNYKGKGIKYFNEEFTKKVGKKK